MTSDDEHIFVKCPICEAAAKGKYQNNDPRKFLICAGGLHAICSECSYRIEMKGGKKR